MKVAYELNGRRYEKEAKDDARFLLTDGERGFVSFARQTQSRYEGWFCEIGGLLHKTIHRLDINGSGVLKKIILGNGFAIRQYEKIEEKLYFSGKVLICELSQPSSLDVLLDVRGIYENPLPGRQYEIEKIPGGILITQNRSGFPPVYIALAGLCDEFEGKNQWLKAEYPLDARRNSPPFESHVCEVVSVKARRMAIRASSKKERAVGESLAALKKNSAKNSNIFNFIRPPIKDDLALAREMAALSLKSLFVSSEKEAGICAGLPWFFQFWARDEAVSLKSALAIDKDISKNIATRLVGLIGNKGTISNSADAPGWAALRAQNILEKNLFNKREKKYIADLLETAADAMQKNRTKDGLALSYPGETWMDSLKRDGARLELQALRAAFYKSAHAFTGKSFYKKMEKEIILKTKEKFWNGQYLNDAPHDKTITPNIFLTAYIYPALLSRGEWEKCFSNVIPRMWCAWGGFSSIDASHPEFNPYSTGENPASYHKGDSWFYINNIAALVLRSIGGKSFASYYKAIIDASTKEILEMGALGHHAELSSAALLESGGCWAQAWSSAMFLEATQK